MTVMAAMSGIKAPPIIISAKSVVKQALDQAQSAFRKASTNMTKSMKSVKDTVAGLSTKIFSLKTALTTLGTAVAGKFITDVATSGREIKLMSIRMGVAAETASAWWNAAEALGLTLDTFEETIRKLPQQTQIAADKFKAYGIATVDANGNLRSTRDLLYDVADVLQNARSEQDQLTIAMGLFGEMGAKLTPFLKDGAQKLREYEEAARRLGTAWTEEEANISMKTAIAVTKTENAFKGLQKAVGTAIGPAVQKAAKDVQDWIVEIREPFANLMKYVSTIFVNLPKVVSIAVEGMKDLLVRFFTDWSYIEGFAKGTGVIFASMISSMAAETKHAGIVINAAAEMFFNGIGSISQMYADRAYAFAYKIYYKIVEIIANLVKKVLEIVKGAIEKMRSPLEAIGIDVDNLTGGLDKAVQRMDKTREKYAGLLRSMDKDRAKTYEQAQREMGDHFEEMVNKIKKSSAATNDAIKQNLWIIKEQIKKVGATDEIQRIVNRVQDLIDKTNEAKKEAAKPTPLGPISRDLSALELFKKPAAKAAGVKEAEAGPMEEKEPEEDPEVKLFELKSLLREKEKTEIEELMDVRDKLLKKEGKVAHKMMKISNSEIGLIIANNKLAAWSWRARENVVGSVTNSLANEYQRLAYAHEFSIATLLTALAQSVTAELSAIAAKASIKALYYTAEGMAASAMGNFAAASAFFTAAGTMAGIAGSAMLGAMAVGAITPTPSQFKKEEGTEEKEPEYGGETEAGTGSGSISPAQAGSPYAAAASQQVVININYPLSTTDWDALTRNFLVPALRRAGVV